MTNPELNALMARLVTRIIDSAHIEMDAAPEAPPHVNNFIAAALVSASARFALDNGKLPDWAFSVGNYMELFATRDKLMTEPQGRA